ncbi:MAG: hypothetical protein BZY80_04165 [SAR202 cluster bacterium Io17-Chloro-G2]|nr:MAG: hypothetical protein BZY80_04165 [SAR202 cluster bacterium Io17-Chloro-G2]
MALTAALCSHLLAWVAFGLLVFAPFYQGESVTATPAEAVPSQPVQTTATLIEINGWGVIPIVLAPVVISGAGLLGVIFAGPGLVWRRAPLGLATLLLLGFCVAGAFSIGMFYLPAALAMAVSAAVGLIQRRVSAVNP